MKDIACPYCGHEHDICHDDGFGYEEDQTHQQQCPACDKWFVFTTFIHFSYSPRKADCLNGSDHVWEPTKTYPRKWSKMWCKQCDEQRQPTADELAAIMAADKAAA